MFRDGSVLEPGVIAQMIRYLGALEVYSHLMAVVGYLDLLTDITKGNTVVMTIFRQLYMAVLHDCAHPEVHNLKRVLWQWFEVGVQRLRKKLAEEQQQAAPRYMEVMAA